MQAEIYTVLTALGLPPSRKGTAYLADAIAICRRHSGNIMLKSIIVLVANTHNTTSSAAERAMRTAVEYMSRYGDINMIYEIFKNTVSPDKGKPTLGEFIWTVGLQLHTDKQK